MKVASTLTTPTAKRVAVACSSGVTKPALVEDLVGVVDDGVDPGDLLEHGEADADHERLAHRLAEHLAPARLLGLRVQVALDLVERLFGAAAASHLGERGDRVLAPSGPHEPPRGLGHRHHDEDEQEARDDRPAEHESPVARAAQEVVDEVRDEDADGDGQLVGGDVAASGLLRGHLRGVQRGRHRGDADAEPDDEPTDHQHRGAGGQRRDGGPGAEEDAGEHARVLAAELVGEPAGQQRADQRAERHPAGDDLGHERAQAEVGLDEVQRAGDDALVVAEQRAGEHRDDAHHRHPEGPPTEDQLAVIACVGRVDRRVGRARHGSPSPQRTTVVPTFRRHGTAPRNRRPGC